MKFAQQLVDKSWKINLLLFICSFGIYTCYFHPVFLHLNSVLSCITGDALKNYFTYSYHVKNDPGILHFSGMIYPFGEHVVFTDCQPILTFILRLLPFTHNYLIGILHALLFGSYIVTPLILNHILLRFDLDKLSCFFIALGITLLSPQFSKINGGHHALAYGFVIPLNILFILSCIEKNSTRSFVTLFAFNLVMFFLHPYVGFSTSLFSFCALGIYSLLNFSKSGFLKASGKTIVVGLVPLFLFQVFMKLSDQHPDRTVEPHGNETLVENFDTLLAPDFGPFKSTLEKIFSHKTGHWEGHSYLGIATIILLVMFLITLPFYLRKTKLKKELIAILISSAVLLMISFGWHLRLLEALHINSPALNQFRATCRFAWFFYYALPLFLVVSLYYSFKSIFGDKRTYAAFSVIAILLFFLSLWEGHFYFTKDKAHFWKFRNILNEKFLNAEERKILAHIKTSNNQAILPLPMFCVGSELYDRIGADYSMIPAMLYSYHSGIPIVSGSMSRTSISETAEMIELLNSYKKDNPVMKRISDEPFLVIKTSDPLMVDEERLLTDVKMFHKNDTLEFGEITRKELIKPKLDKKLVAVNGRMEADSSNIVYIPTENKHPFIPTIMKDLHAIYVLDSNRISSGTYIVSLHYHYTRKVYTSFDNSLIISKGKGSEYNWEHYQRVSVFSGFYPGFAVMEYKLKLEKDSRYEFMLQGSRDLDYHISHFMIRPEGTSIICKENGKTILNNFPD